MYGMKMCVCVHTHHKHTHMAVLSCVTWGTLYQLCISVFLSNEDNPNTANEMDIMKINE